MPIPTLILAPLLALQATPACPTSAPPPPELASWATATATPAGASGDGAPTLAIGTAIDAALIPTPRLRYPAAPAKPGTPVSHGGVFTLTVDHPGRYRVALGAGAWIDVVQGGKALASAAHGHGPACSGVRKMVDYDLAAGRYLVQVVGSADPVVRMMVARLP